ncbi:hypothetical protein EUGRSUZ_J01426 [Eucalyptus grandis]|uniref:Uncharacterized protein n=2 Tax=Eucalyptus grandis TaxID=71139 RepID=A0ACC3J583_EUCGR|nr:hypothetical protein EUGRSUZ_J01426 [Eucalyptus grandis]
MVPKGRGLTKNSPPDAWPTRRTAQAPSSLRSKLRPSIEIEGKKKVGSSKFRGRKVGALLSRRDWAANADGCFVKNPQKSVMGTRRMD